MRDSGDSANAASSDNWIKVYLLWIGQNANTKNCCEWKPLQLEGIYPIGLAINSTVAKTNY